MDQDGHQANQDLEILKIFLRWNIIAHLCMTKAPKINFTICADLTHYNKPINIWVKL